MSSRVIYVPNNAVSTLPKLLGHGVSLVDDEVLVEDLKDLTPLKIRHGAFVFPALVVE